MFHEIRDSVGDFVNFWTDRAEISNKQLLGLIGLYESTFDKWVRSYGVAFEHNGAIPRDHRLEDWEKDAIIRLHFEHPLDGYRRLTDMMLDAEDRRCQYRERLSRVECRRSSGP